MKRSWQFTPMIFALACIGVLAYLELKRQHREAEDAKWDATLVDSFPASDAMPY